MSETVTIETDENVGGEQFADMALEVGVFLISSGAHCGRVLGNLTRLADRWGFAIHIHPTFTGLTITAKKLSSGETVTRYLDAPPHKAQLSVLTRFSHLTWRVLEEKLSFDFVRRQLVEIKAERGYNYWLVAVVVGLACACLCMLAGGDVRNGACAFVAAFAGAVVRVWMQRMRFNSMLVIIAAALTTTLIAGLDMIWRFGAFPETTLATSVLYLIPGVALVNSVIDLIEGHMVSSMARGLYAAFHLLCIATGMTVAITVLGISHF